MSRFQTIRICSPTEALAQQLLVTVPPLTQIVVEKCAAADPSPGSVMAQLRAEFDKADTDGSQALGAIISSRCRVCDLLQ